jgi:tetratricopeptide (TPR) repeat protein
MLQAGYLTAADNPRDKRSRIYHRIKDGFFDLWLAMNESHSQRKRLGYLVKILEVWYQNRMERESKRSELRRGLHENSSATAVKENQLAYLGYLSELGAGDERCEAKLDPALDLFKTGDSLKAKDLLMEIKPLAPPRGIFTWMTDQALRWADSGPDEDIVQWFDGLIHYWKIQRSGDLEKAVDIAQRLGEELSGAGLHKVRIELLKDAVECASTTKDKIDLYFQIAKSQKMGGQLEPALHSLKKALDHCLEIGDRSGLCATLFNIGHIHMQNNEPGEAVAAWTTVYAIAREIKLAQALNALESLARQLGQEGLAFWDNLRKQIKA